MKLLLEEGVVLPEIEDFGKIALIKGDQRVNYKELIEHSGLFSEHNITRSPGRISTKLAKLDVCSMSSI